MKLALAADDDSALSSGTSTVCLLLEAENVAAISQTKTVPSIRWVGVGGSRSAFELKRSHGDLLGFWRWFSSLLTSSIQHSSIKVYLSATRSLHIEEGFPDPLFNCLRLQRVMRGIKRSQDFPSAHRLPVTDSILFLIHKALDLSTHDRRMFWAACALGYFGFLRSAEFTVPNLASFSPTTHLSVADIAVDSTVSASCIRLRMKAPRLTQFGRAATCILAGLLLSCVPSKLCWPIFRCGAMFLAHCFCSPVVNL